MPNLAVELTKRFEDLDPEVKTILGRPNFACAGIANTLRDDGVNIPRKAEAEQAACIQFMLSLWEHHGDKWAEEGDKILAEMRMKKSAGKLAQEYLNGLPGDKTTD